LKEPAEQQDDAVGYHSLLRDLAHEGCPACRGASRAAWRAIGAILWESVNDSGIRTQLRASHGFCREHALMAISVAEERALSSGMAIMYEDFLRHVREDAIAAVADFAKRGRSRRDIHPRSGCLPCSSVRRVASNYIFIMSRAAADSEVGVAARQTGRFLCLPHLRQGLLEARSQEDAERLLRLFCEGEEGIRRDLLEFARKHDYRYQAEGMSHEEATSWLGAVYQMIGGPPPSRSSEID